MFPVETAPSYVRETLAAAARLQEGTRPEQVEALVERAERLLEGLFTVDVNLEPDLMAKIAIRERFVPVRVKQAILMVATHRLITELAAAWSVRKIPVPARAAVLAGA